MREFWPFECRQQLQLWGVANHDVQSYLLVGYHRHAGLPLNELRSVKAILVIQIGRVGRILEAKNGSVSISYRNSKALASQL